MAFTSAAFCVLVLLALIGYYLVPGRLQWAVLLAASYVFYLWGGVGLTGYLVAATSVTYLAGRRLGRLNACRGQMDKTVWKRKKRLVAAAALVFNFGMLYLLKYLDGTMALISHVTGTALPVFHLAIPLGVSYYVFQSSGYVIDCYRGKHEIAAHFGKYALFVSFFPQMVQGPIGRYHDLGPQLAAPHKLDWEALRSGVQLVLWGCLKKLVIADRAGVVVSTVLGSWDSYPGSLLAFGILFYCVQLYCDFSGGIDIARGVAQMFGITLAENFRRPIFATSLADYWRRWHITLGAWMRDYVFYPLSLSKPFSRLGKFSRKHFGGLFGKILPTSAATFVVYLIIGVWHGSSLKYIAYGLFNGVIITASLLLEPTFVRAAKGLRLDRNSPAWRAVRMVRTGCIVFVGRYLTRAPSLRSALSMLRTTVTNFSPSALAGGALLNLGVTKLDYLVMLLGMAALLIVEGIQERGTPIRATLAKKPAPVQYLAMAIPLAAVLIFGVWIKGEIATGFIYMQF